MKLVKLLISMAILGVWGPYLILVWINPSYAPACVTLPGFRKAFMLDSAYEPTFFTLIFGVGFTGLVLFGMFRILTGKVDLGR